MVGKPRPTPSGHVKLSYIEKGTGGRWKAHTLRRCIRDGTWRKKTGLGKGVLHIRPVGIHIQQEAADRLIAEASTHTVNITQLARETGMVESALHRVGYVSRRWVGDGWYTTNEDAKKVRVRHDVKGNSHGTSQAAGIIGADRHTVRQWFKTGKLPGTMGYPDRVPAWWLERHKGGYVYNAETRRWEFPEVVRRRDGRWSVKLPGKPPEKKPPPGRLELIRERHRKMVQGRDITEWLGED